MPRPRRDSLIVAVAAGLVLGVATRGTTYARARGRARVLAASPLTAAFAGEAVLFALLVHHPGRAGTYLLAIAMALPFLLLRRARERLLALTISAFLAGVALVAEGGVFVVTRYMV